MNNSAKNSPYCPVCNNPDEMHVQNQRMCRVCGGVGEIATIYEDRKRHRDATPEAQKLFRVRCRNCIASSDLRFTEEDAWVAWYEFNKREGTLKNGNGEE